MFRLRGNNSRMQGAAGISNQKTNSMWQVRSTLRLCRVDVRRVSDSPKIAFKGALRLRR